MIPERKIFLVQNIIKNSRVELKWNDPHLVETWGHFLNMNIADTTYVNFRIEVQHSFIPLPLKVKMLPNCSTHTTQRSLENHKEFICWVCWGAVCKNKMTLVSQKGNFRTSDSFKLYCFFSYKNHKTYVMEPMEYHIRVIWFELKSHTSSSSSSKSSLNHVGVSYMNSVFPLQSILGQILG